MTVSTHNEMVDLPDSFAGLANLIDAAITKVAAMPLGLASDADLLAGMEILERAWRRADGANAAVLMEISDRSVYTKAGCRSMKKFLAEHHRLGNAEANRRLTTAAAIGRFTATTGEKLPPKREPVATGVAEGTISGEHVHEIELVMTKVPHSAPPDDVELAVQILSEAATELAPADLRKVGQRLLAHLDPDGSLTDEKDRRRMRGISIGPQDKQLMSKISGYITPTLRAKLEVLLDNWAKPGMNNPDDENPLVGSVAELSDEDRERLTEAIRTDQRTSAQRNHDAFERGLDWVLGHEALGKPKRLPVHVVVTVEERDLARHAGVGLTATGTRVPVGDLVGLAAGAVPWLAVFADFTRKIVDFGHGKRLATMPQRIAMFATYLGCSRPGCTRPSSQTEAHHGILDYADGGVTDLADLAPACGPDNRNVGTRPGQWETGRITDGPDAGLIGWRLVGTDDPFRVNRVHDPRAYLRGSRFEGERDRESDVEPPGDANPPTSADEPTSSPRRRSGPRMLRMQPDHRGGSLNGLTRQRHPARDRQPRPGRRQRQRSHVETAIESRLISVA